jgi:RNA polymerase sigma factor (sigma-70 family)
VITNAEKLRDEFLAIFSEYSTPLFYYVLKLTENEDTAKDVVQECFVRVWENIEKIDKSAPVLPLLITYIKNLMRDEFRKNKNYRHLLAEISESAKGAMAPPDAEFSLALRDRQQQLDHSLNLLSEKRKNIFRLIKIEGLSYKEVAETLDLSIPDIKKQMRLSLQFLRKVMNACFFFL